MFAQLPADALTRRLRLLRLRSIVGKSQKDRLSGTGRCRNRRFPLFRMPRDRHVDDAVRHIVFQLPLEADIAAAIHPHAGPQGIRITHRDPVAPDHFRPHPRHRAVAPDEGKTVSVGQIPTAPDNDLAPPDRSDFSDRFAQCLRRVPAAHFLRTPREHRSRPAARETAVRIGIETALHPPGGSLAAGRMRGDVPVQHIPVVADIVLHIRGILEPSLDLE